jgi:hypothetical protein
MPLALHTLTTRNTSGLIYVTTSYKTCTKQRIKSEGDCARRLAPFRALSIFLKGPVYFEECEHIVANIPSLFQNLPEGCDAKKRTMNYGGLVAVASLASASRKGYIGKVSNCHGLLSVSI